MRGRVGTLAVALVQFTLFGKTSYNPDESYCDEDRHKAPAQPHIHPLSLQGGGTSFPFIGKIYQGEDPEYRPLDENLFVTYTACNSSLNRVAGVHH